jgi:hypothetical protein
MNALLNSPWCQFKYIMSRSWTARCKLRCNARIFTLVSVDNGRAARPRHTRAEEREERRGGARGGGTLQRRAARVTAFFAAASSAAYGFADAMARTSRRRGDARWERERERRRGGEEEEEEEEAPRW